MGKEKKKQTSKDTKSTRADKPRKTKVTGNEESNTLRNQFERGSKHH